MPEYMLLLYAPEVDEAGQADRWTEMPLWEAATDSLREAGLLVANGPLHPVTSATTVRVRDGEDELTDGPFADQGGSRQLSQRCGLRSVTDVRDLRLDGALVDQ